MRYRLRGVIAFLAAVLAGGTISFVLAEGLSPLDALYFTVVTVTTVGFGDIAPTTALGKVLTLVLAPAGLVAVFGLGLSLIEDQVRSLILTGGVRPMERKLAAISGHFIVCGYGRLGSNVVKELRSMKKEVVVVDRDEHALRGVEDPGIIPVVGEALTEEVLQKAGIGRARALVTTFRDDTSNVYVVLEAREITQDIEIVSAASSREAARRLYLAGATRVVSPDLVGAEMLAKSAVNPAVLQLMSRLTDPRGLVENLSQVVISEGSRLAGVTLDRLRSMGVSAKIVMIRDGDSVEFLPTGSSMIRGGSVLVAACPADQLEKLEELASAPD